MDSLASRVWRALSYHHALPRFGMTPCKVVAPSMTDIELSACGSRAVHDHVASYPQAAK